VIFFVMDFPAVRLNVHVLNMVFRDVVYVYILMMYSL